MKVSKIILYDEPTVPEIHMDKIQEFITDTFPVQVSLRANFFKTFNERIFEKIATTRIFELKKQFKKHKPSSIDIQNEKENTDTSRQEEIALYDGFEMQRTVTEFIPIHERTDEIFHIIFTNKTTCTFDSEYDYRYHARALIGSNPTIISTTGIIEAPAKPKSYYLDLMTCFSREEIKQVEERYKDQFLKSNDSRIHDAAEGYILQSIMYYETGEAFCNDKECRLFNAHWQKDLITSQIENKKFCKKHSKILKLLQSKTKNSTSNHQS